MAKVQATHHGQLAMQPHPMHRVCWEMGSPYGQAPTKQSQHYAHSAIPRVWQAAGQLHQPSQACSACNVQSNQVVHALTQTHNRHSPQSCCCPCDAAAHCTPCSAAARCCAGRCLIKKETCCCNCAVSARCCASCSAMLRRAIGWQPGSAAQRSSSCSQTSGAAPACSTTHRWSHTSAPDHTANETACHTMGKQPAALYKCPL